MVEWAVTSKGVRGFGRAGDVRVEATDWRPHANEQALPTAVDATVPGSATGLRLPTRNGTLVGAGGRYDLSTVGRLPAATFTLTVDDGVETTVVFRGPAAVRRRDDGTSIRFDGRQPVTVGFRERAGVPPTIRVPDTPAGVATAITCAAATPMTTAPERSHPSNRPHPPLVRFGEHSMPADVDGTPTTGIEFHVPPSYAELYVIAPLAYYAGASVTVGATRPVIRIPDAGVVHRLPSGEALSGTVADVLRRLFFLDCFVRETEGPGRLVPEGVAPRDELAAYAASTMAERLATVLDGGLRELDGDLPEWQLSTYVAPEPDNARALPYLLDRLSLVYPPSASTLDGSALLRRTLEDFYRGREEPCYRAAGGDVVTAERLDPDLRGGHAHAWLADGIPIGACKASTVAYENRLRHERVERDRLRVDVVLNDAEMVEERSVARIYRERAGDLPIDVTVHESLTRRELAAVFAARTDFIHYIGHCEVAGLKCADGYLSTAGLEVGARTFFLNACGSFREGLSLVEGGAAAGGVTLTKVLNEQAATVGTAFARLLVEGFDIERALSLARRQILMGQDYAVVGDGTYTLAPAKGHPAVVHVSRVGDPEADIECAGGSRVYDVSYEVVTGRSAGRSYRNPFTGVYRVHGTTAEATLTRSALRAFLATRTVPVLEDGELRWSDAVVESLSN
jgi:hypothetical protein